MRKLIPLVLSLCLFLPQAYAKHHGHSSSSKVVFRLAMEDWVKTNSARVVLSVNATANQSQIAKIRGEMQRNLNAIAKGDWHFTSFNRSRDNSGLEKIYAQAQARLSEEVLGGLYAGAEKVSKPGSKYQVVTIDFSPSLAEVEAARKALREKIYGKVKQEIAKLNEMYPEQKYRVKHISFIPASIRPQIRFSTRNMKAAGAMMEDAPAAPITVSQKVNMQVMVKVAADNAKPKHG